MLCGIYLITNTLTGKLYVGSSKNISRRWLGHRASLRHGKHCNTYLQRAWNHYGENAFTLTVLEECPIDDLLTIEQYYLDWLEPFDEHGYNLARTADAPAINMSNETRSKMSAAKRGKAPSNKGKPMSEEQKYKLSIAHRGQVSSNKGKRMSEEQKAKLRIACKGILAGEKHPFFGKHHTEETKEKIRLAKLGSKHTEETKRKMSIAHTEHNPCRGRPSSLKGIPRTQEVKDKISAAHKGRTFTPEHRRHLSEAHKGKRLSDEQRFRRTKAYREQLATHSSSTNMNVSDIPPALTNERYFDSMNRNKD